MVDSPRRLNHTANNTLRGDSRFLPFEDSKYDISIIETKPNDDLNNNNTTFVNNTT